MKTINIIKIALLAIFLVMLISSCSKKFLERTPVTSISNELALTTLDGCEQAAIGLIRALTLSSYNGRDLTVIGDLVTDNVTTSLSSSGHLKDIEEWNISPSLGEITSLWSNSYYTIATAAKVLGASRQLLINGKEGDEEGKVLEADDKKRLEIVIATALIFKTYGEYIASQYFCLPINQGRDKNGLILLYDQPYGIEDPVVIATLGETYDLMMAQLDEAIAIFNEQSKNSISTSIPRYLPNVAVAYILKARLYQSMGEQEAAYDAVNSVIDLETFTAKLLPAGASPNLYDTYKALSEAYKSGSNTTEDIFVINYNVQDNLSATSIGNMFGTYGANIAEPVLKFFGNRDIRKQLYQKLDETATNEDDRVYSTCGKYPNQNMINNVPVFRVPEIYLIAAEAKAESDPALAKTLLLKVWGVRDSTMKDAADIDAYMEREKIATLKDLVLIERRREFVGEGHRWFDMRRNLKKLTHDGEVSVEKKNLNSFRIVFTDYPLYNFAYPIPESETNTEQWQAGKNAGTAQQNEAWSEVGTTFEPVFPLPINGSIY